MKKYNSVFSTFHTIYRLSTTSADMKNFSIGVCRAYRNAFKADRVVMVCKNVNSYPYIKIKLEDKVQNIKKGGVSILTGREKDLFMQEREMVLGCRMIAPFNFMDTLGAIYIKRKEVFTDSERRWFSALSDEVSLALKIFCQNREEKKLMINYVKTLTRMMNQFVPTSHLHIKSIFRLIHALGKSMALSEIEIQTLEYASLLHDAGKLDIPTKLLKKQKPLTNEEFKLIMKHPRKGAQMIKDMDLLKPVIPIIMHHHERFDGKGYPSRLKKDQIPLAARILSVIDAFDAMYFGRPYRKRKPLEEITKELKKQSAKQFDPKVIDAFLKILKRKDIKKHLKLCR